MPSSRSSFRTGRFTVPVGYTGYIDSVTISNAQGDNMEVGVFSTSQTFPLQQKDSLIIYTTSNIGCTTIPEKYTIVHGGARFPIMQVYEP